MTKIKTSELIDQALNWAVEKCNGKYLVDFNIHFRAMCEHSGHSPARADQLLAQQPLKDKWCVIVGRGFAQEIPNYSTDWSQGGPIVEREGINLLKVGIKNWRATMDYGSNESPVFHDVNPLIAAMRCLVASKLGNEVEIPEELL